jgi:rod shape determining protein RodA
MVRYGVGVAIMLAIGMVDLQRLAKIAYPLYAVAFILLVYVEFAGEIGMGAQRWINLGSFQLQPSELMKISLCLVLARYFHGLSYEEIGRPWVLVPPALMALLPAGLVLKQPDLGTSLLIGASGFYVLFLAGLSWRLMLGLAVAAGAAMPFLWGMLHDYQRRRIEILLDPTQDPLGAGYHTIQATIALGSGGLSGKGWLNGTQSQLDFLPERHTDFIFAVFGEEFGLVGNLLLLLLFAVIIGRGMIIAANGQNAFCRLLGGTIALTFFTYAFVNMGMVSGILPVVGVPLPLISYGGTSLVTLMIGFGILMSIQTHKKMVTS